MVTIYKDTPKHKIDTFIKENQIIPLDKDPTKSFQKHIQQTTHKYIIIINKNQQKHLIQIKPTAPKLNALIKHINTTNLWAGSSVGIATELRAGRSGIESRWGRDFPPVQTGPGAQPASCKMGTGSFPEVNCDRGVLLTTHSFLVPRSWKSRAILILIVIDQNKNKEDSITNHMYNIHKYLEFKYTK